MAEHQNSLIAFLKVFENIRFDDGFVFCRKTDKIHAREINAAPVFKIGFEITQEIDFLEGGT